MKIGLDIMSGDNAPLSNIKGAIRYINNSASKNNNIILYGNENILKNNINLIKNKQILSNDEEVANIFNNFFTNAVKQLDV